MGDNSHALSLTPDIGDNPPPPPPLVKGFWVFLLFYFFIFNNLFIQRRVYRQLRRNRWKYKHVPRSEYVCMYVCMYVCTYIRRTKRHGPRRATSMQAARHCRSRRQRNQPNPPPPPARSGGMAWYGKVDPSNLVNHRTSVFNQVRQTRRDSKKKSKYIHTYVYIFSYGKPPSPLPPPPSRGAQSTVCKPQPSP
jgi:hypothetical protein